jgi:methanogenic corrinoid protein MtbC1
MELLLAGDRHTASSLILGQAASGMPVRDIYLQVLSPAQQALGQLWQEGSISVALEHFATAATQMIMGQLFPYIIGEGHAQRRNGAGFVGCCVAGELHEIGMRMVCDLLEMEGFDTWYLGANTPDTAIIDFLADKLQESPHRPLVLGVSVTLVQGVPLARNLIVSMRKDPRLDGVRVLVGGLPFLNRPNLWSEVGADGHAADASEATRTLTQLTRISTEGLL